jgi:hypothetical protein
MGGNRKQKRGNLTQKNIRNNKIKNEETTETKI